MQTGAGSLGYPYSGGATVRVTRLMGLLRRHILRYLAYAVPNFALHPTRARKLFRFFWLLRGALGFALRPRGAMPIGWAPAQSRPPGPAGTGLGGIPHGMTAHIYAVRVCGVAGVCVARLTDRLSIGLRGTHRVSRPAWGDAPEEAALVQAVAARSEAGIGAVEMREARFQIPRFNRQQAVQEELVGDLRGKGSKRSHNA
jgi:hypothetical protein